MSNKTFLVFEKAKSLPTFQDEAFVSNEIFQDKLICLVNPLLTLVAVHPKVGCTLTIPAANVIMRVHAASEARGKDAVVSNGNESTIVWLNRPDNTINDRNERPAKSSQESFKPCLIVDDIWLSVAEHSARL
jgi:hypothetical protein